MVTIVAYCSYAAHAVLCTDVGGQNSGSNDTESMELSARETPGSHVFSMLACFNVCDAMPFHSK